MHIAIIPARGGSKRIPRKNVKPFMGKPMILWSIEAAKRTGLFDHIVVTTDDAEIIDLVQRHGAIAPFVRPPELSDDHTALDAVLKHALNHVIETIGTPDYVCTIFATAPFIESEEIAAGLDRLKESGAEIAFTVANFGFPIQRALKILPNGRMGMFQPEHLKTRSQDLEPAYHDAAQFYWSTPGAILNDIAAFSEHAVPIVLPRYKVQDIDTPEDWDRAELMFKAWQAEKAK